MRVHHIIAVFVVFVIALGVKFLLPPKQAAAGLVPSVNMNVLQMQRELNMKNLPVQDIRDKTFVFDDE